MIPRSAGRVLGYCLVGALGATCARASGEPTAPDPRAPLVISPAPDSGPSEEPRAELPRRTEPERPSDDERGPDERNDDLQIEVERDGGSFSFRAHTVRDGGVSLRISGSISVSTDGGSVSVTISPDAGSP